MSEDCDMWKKYLEGAACSLRLAMGSVGISGQYEAPIVKPYNRRAIEAIRGVLPYCLHPITYDDEKTLIFLNRDYKPLGIMPYGHRVDYEQFPWMHVEKSNPAISLIIPKLKEIVGFGVDAPIYFFYGDLSGPCRSKRHAENLLYLMETILFASEGGRK